MASEDALGRVPSRRKLSLRRNHPLANIVAVNVGSPEQSPWRRVQSALPTTAPAGVICSFRGASVIPLPECGDLASAKVFRSNVCVYAFRN